MAWGFVFHGHGVGYKPWGILRPGRQMTAPARGKECHKRHGGDPSR